MKRIGIKCSAVRCNKNWKIGPMLNQTGKSNLISGQHFFYLSRSFSDLAKPSSVATHCRRFILITLSNAEKCSVTREQCIERVRMLFSCTTITVARENPNGESSHFHIGIRNTDASKNNATKKICSAFPEFDGMQCNVKFHRRWETLYAIARKKTDRSSATKRDKAPT